MAQIFIKFGVCSITWHIPVNLQVKAKSSWNLGMSPFTYLERSENMFKMILISSCIVCVRIVLTHILIISIVNCDCNIDDHENIRLNQ